VVILSKIIFFSFLSFILAVQLSFADENKNITEAKERVIDHIKSRMKEPVLKEEKTPLPDLIFFTAYEKAWLVEDPLIPINFYLYKNGEVKRNFDIKEVLYTPVDKESAVAAAVWMLNHSYSYLMIKKSEYQEDKDAFRILIETDFYYDNPYFRKNSKKNVLFIVSCVQGKWSIKEPEDLWDGNRLKK
jgi:hypothetical protein